MAMLPGSPITGVGAANSLIAPAQGIAATPFQDIFRQALHNVEETRAISSADNMAVARGEVDNIAEIMINSQRAEVALQMMLQLRNSILDSYNEIMRMGI